MTADAGVVQLHDAAIPGDDAQGFVYSLDVYALPGMEPPPVTVSIDDTATSEVLDAFETYSVAATKRYHIVTRYRGNVISRLERGPSECEVFESFGGMWTESHTGVCLMPNGELRIDYTGCTSSTGGGIADWFCDAPACWPAQDGCDRGLRCGRVIANANPLLSHLQCVPIGTVPVGGSCDTGTPGEHTGYDDCVPGAVCLNGTCERFCGAAADCAPDEYCLPVPGLLGEARTCGSLALP